ncbi:MAG: hypothetical protein MJE68_07155 [Proteobacteria bacterium]|nr:hypothetical protein [Pseudomonadota bacterium]
MALDFMSSEESTSEHDSDSDTEECFTIRKISWRSEKVEDFFKNKLDALAANSASKKSKKMRFKRVEGESTSRPPPLRRYKDCLWLFHKNAIPVAY